MHIALATLASSSNNMTPTSWIGLVVAFIGVVVLCFNGWRKGAGGKLSVKLLVVGAALITGGMILASTAMQSSP